MANITLYAFDTPNGRKISVALEEMALPYHAKVVDLNRNEQFNPAFLAISPNHKIPAIVDAEGPEEQCCGLERFGRETRRLYRVMDRRLAAEPYFAGEPSIADFAILGWAWRHPRHQVNLAEYPHVKDWYERMMARPATRRGFDVALR